MTTSYPPPSLDGQWIGVRKLTNATIANVWTTLTSADLYNFVTGLALPAGKTFVVIVLDNIGTEGDAWIVGYPLSSVLDPSVLNATVPVKPGQSFTTGVYGCAVTSISVCLKPSASVVLVATFYPY